ncbi:amino acid ABC transporter permease [Microvirga sp. TS319]|uniref:amino acid ABC transporter permease n=1 Tax=Microvirga sp. TS319 TaxID=3241165 RepID=UPI00351A4C01
MKFNLAFAIESLPLILSALWTTVWVTVASCAGAALLGFLWEIARRSSRPLSYVMRFVIDFIRSTPLLVQLYFLYFVLPFYGVTLPSFVVGIVGLSVYYSGYLAEVFKAGIDGIPVGQFEAAQSLGLKRLDIVAFVIAPQMLRNIAAPMGNYFVSVLKATPYLAIIAVPEMLGEAMEIASDTFRYAEPMLTVGVVFLVLAVAVAQLVRLMEMRLLKSARR